MSGDESDIFSESIAVQEGPHHSTPIKDGPFKRPQRLGRVTARVEPSSPVRHVVSDGHQTAMRLLPLELQTESQQHSRIRQSPRSKSITESPNMDTSTVQKQRREIQLLIHELRDRDNELNETMSAHSHQLLAWERDRQRLLTLEQKCARYESDLHKKRKQLEVAMSKLKASQSLEVTKTSNLNTTQQELDRISREKQHTVAQVDNLEKQNVSLNDSLKAISGTVGQLEAREQELMTLLHLKEKDIDQATGNLIELNSRVQQLDLRCKECQNREAEALHRATQWKQKYTHARSEIETLTDAVQTKDNELEQHGKQTAGLHQQLMVVQEELLITGERERRKDEVIESLRSKQERTLAELRSVRELYERQQRELTLLQLNLDSSRENSNHNSNLDHSVALDDSISCHGHQQVEHVSPGQRDAGADNRHVSFEERLSSFLDEDTDVEALCHLDASPASKLQRLLTESRMMIENLEKTTLPATTNMPMQGSSNPEVSLPEISQNPSVQEVRVVQQGEGSTESGEYPGELYHEQLRDQLLPQNSHNSMSRHSRDYESDMQTYTNFMSRDLESQESVFVISPSHVAQEVFTDIETSDILRRQMDS